MLGDDEASSERPSRIEWGRDGERRGGQEVGRHGDVRGRVGMGQESRLGPTMPSQNRVWGIKFLCPCLHEESVVLREDSREWNKCRAYAVTE